MANINPPPITKSLSFLLTANFSCETLLKPKLFADFSARIFPSTYQGAVLKAP